MAWCLFQWVTLQSSSLSLWLHLLAEGLKLLLLQLCHHLIQSVDLIIYTNTHTNTLPKCSIIKHENIIHLGMGYTSALCLCFSSCWADFCLALSPRVGVELSFGLSLRQAGSMVSDSTGLCNAQTLSNKSYNWEDIQWLGLGVYKLLLIG